MLGLQRALQHLPEAVDLKRLLQNRPIAMRIGQAAVAVPGRKNERSAARRKRIRNGCYWLAIEIDIQYCEIEVGAAHGFQSLLKAACFCHDRIAELAKHVLE